MDPPPPPPPRSPLRPPPQQQSIAAVLSKRQHALHELMSSERAYASDLTLILEVHIPLGAWTPQGPMTAEDIKTIFGNIAELAELSDVFCEALERCIGSALDDPDATDDHIGELFLRYAPELETPYKQYITRHPSALAHLTALPQTPELTAYHQKTRDAAVSLSHAWDLASLLIKPVQRLLKYSLLLTAILDATALTHPDRPHLLNARTAMEDVARQVNEGRRRAEVVKEVLTAPKKPPTVLRIKSFRAPADADTNSEAARVERMASELARIDVFAQQLARVTQEWARAADAAAHFLLSWAKSFAGAIGLSGAVRSEAFDTFIATLTAHILPAASALLPTLASDVLGPLARLLASAAQPRQLLASMAEHAPLHHHLLTMPVTPKNRPPPALLASSSHYLALRTQLAAELPSYLALLHRGLAALVRRLAAVQGEWFRESRDAWAGLWDMLRVEGERKDGGGAETEAVWRARWGDVERAVGGLRICMPLRGSAVSSAASSTLAAHVSSVLAALDPPSSSSRHRGSGGSHGRDNAHGHGHGHGIGGALGSAGLVAGLGALAPTSGAPYAQPYAPSTYAPSTYAPSSYAPSVHNASGAAGTSPPTSGMSLSISGPFPLGMRARGGSDAISGTSGAGRAPSRPPSRARLVDEQGAFAYASPRQAPAPPGSASVPITPRSSRSRPPSPTDPSLPAPSPSPSPSRDPGPEYETYDPSAFTADRRATWLAAPALYTCRVVHPCTPPAAAPSYFGFPFFALETHALLGVLHEAGHPGSHPRLPLYVDEGEDCLLLCRDGAGKVGWALASFLAPLVGE
ncbi:hypothetical protein C8R45DRAFT_898742 [Mycena sanguinolenta]|nr:hypothetical protein C8R45DRAFT_898742 [Mycena sanguinolenta]